VVTSWHSVTPFAWLQSNGLSIWTAIATDAVGPHLSEQYRTDRSVRVF